MSEIGIKELASRTSRVIESVEDGERVVVTKRGRPAAVIMSVDEAEDFVLAHAEEFVKMRLSGRRAHRSGKSTPMADL